MNTPEEKIAALGLTLPAPPSAGGNYLPYRRVGNLLYCAGVISVENGVITTGQVGAERTIEEGYAAAKICALNALATIVGAAGSLSAIKQLVSVSGYVNAVSGFDSSPLVINGASDLFIEVLGDVGQHARAAVAVAGLPKNATVEIQVICELA